jgi:hypothetical protein
VSPPLDFSTFYPVLVQGKAAEMRPDTGLIHLSRTQHLTGQQMQSYYNDSGPSTYLKLHYTYFNKPVVYGQDIHWPYQTVTLKHTTLICVSHSKSTNLSYETYATETHSLQSCGTNSHSQVHSVFFCCYLQCTTCKLDYRGTKNHFRSKGTNNFIHNCTPPYTVTK